MKRTILWVFAIFAVVSVFAYASASVASAAPTQTNSRFSSGCNTSVSLPFEWHGEITATGNASCGYSYLSYFQVCIMKDRRFLPDKTIACSKMDPLGGYMANDFGPSTLDAVGYCNGAGDYYSELRWSTLSLRDVARLLAKKPGASTAASLGYDYYIKGSMGSPQKRTPSVFMCD